MVATTQASLPYTQQHICHLCYYSDSTGNGLSTAFLITTWCRGNPLFFAHVGAPMGIPCRHWGGATRSWSLSNSAAMARVGLHRMRYSLAAIIPTARGCLLSSECSCIVVTVISCPTIIYNPKNNAIAPYTNQPLRLHL